MGLAAKAEGKVEVYGTKLWAEGFPIGASRLMTPAIDIDNTSNKAINFVISCAC